jgi:hypothetical protein
MKTYRFPTGRIVKVKSNFYEVPDWCQHLRIKRDRAYVLKALLTLRDYKRGGVNMSKLAEIDKTLAEMSELMAKLTKQREELAAKKWEPEGGEYYVAMDGEIDNVGDEDVGADFGIRRRTFEKAQMASREMRKFNRLLALRDEICGADMTDWDKEDDYKYYLYYSHLDLEWRFAPTVYWQAMTPYFPTTVFARLACDMINSGQVKL